MKQAKIKSCTKDYTGTYKIALDNGEVFYSSREYKQDQVIKYHMFMGMIRVIEQQEVCHVDLVRVSFSLAQVLLIARVYRGMGRD